MRIPWQLLKPFSLYLRTVQGRHLIPPTPCIIAANHLSSLDVLVLIVVFRRPITFIAQGRLMNDWLHRLINFTIGQAIVAGDHAVTQAISAIRNNQTIGIFPEGEIHPHYRNGQLHTGASVISHLAQAPIIPVHITGTDCIWPVTFWPLRPWRIHSVDVIIGAPINPLPVEKMASRQEYQRQSRELWQSINQLNTKKPSL